MEKDGERKMRKINKHEWFHGRVPQVAGPQKTNVSKITMALGRWILWVQIRLTLGWPMELCNFIPAESDSCFSRFNLASDLNSREASSESM